MTLNDQNCTQEKLIYKSKKIAVKDCYVKIVVETPLLVELVL